MQPERELLLALFNKLLVERAQELLGRQHRTLDAVRRELQRETYTHDVADVSFSIRIVRSPSSPLDTYFVVEVLKVVVPMTHDPHGIVHLHLQEVDRGLGAVVAHILMADDADELGALVVPVRAHAVTTQDLILWLPIRSFVRPIDRLWSSPSLDWSEDNTVVPFVVRLGRPLASAKRTSLFGF